MAVAASTPGGKLGTSPSRGSSASDRDEHPPSDASVQPASGFDYVSDRQLRYLVKRFTDSKERFCAAIVGAGASEETARDRFLALVDELLDVLTEEELITVGNFFRALVRESATSV